MDTERASSPWISARDIEKWRWNFGNITTNAVSQWITINKRYFNESITKPFNENKISTTDEKIDQEWLDLLK